MTYTDMYVCCILYICRYICYICLPVTRTILINYQDDLIVLLFTPLFLKFFLTEALLIYSVMSIAAVK